MWIDFQNPFIALSQDKIIQIKAHLSYDIVIQGFLADELKAECFVKAFSLMIICDNVNAQLFLLVSVIAEGKKLVYKMMNMIIYGIATKLQIEIFVMF